VLPSTLAVALCCIHCSRRLRVQNQFAAWRQTSVGGRKRRSSQPQRKHRVWSECIVQVWGTSLVDPGLSRTPIHQELGYRQRNRSHSTTVTSVRPCAERIDQPFDASRSRLTNSRNSRARLLRRDLDTSRTMVSLVRLGSGYGTSYRSHHSLADSGFH
jgi:hypothetical protein